MGKFHEVMNAMYDRGFPLAAETLYQRWRDYNAYDQMMIAKAWGGLTGDISYGYRDIFRNRSSVAGMCRYS